MCKLRLLYTSYVLDDHSRVVLRTTHDGNDYINANYIEASTFSLHFLYIFSILYSHLFDINNCEIVSKLSN